MCVSSAHDGSLQKTIVTIYTHQCLHDEGNETEVVLRSLARSVEQHASIGRETPVVVLTRTVDAGERLLVEQCTETVLACHLLHQRHEKHVMVNGEVCLLEDRSEFKLVRSHLIVTCLARNAKFEGTYLKVFHEGLYTIWNSTEIVVFHLLVLCRVVTHECAAGEQQVGTC